eukprot:3160759-Heterocapsa_arctica.AAC.1
MVSGTGPPVVRHVISEFFTPGRLLPVPWLPVGDTQSGSMTSTALQERQVRTSSLDFIMQLCFRLRDIQ